jgi:threonine dehydratase
MPVMTDAAYLADHLSAIRGAAARIAPHVRRTPALPAGDLHPGLVVKPELLQPTGSFKVRGAFNAVLSLLERDPHPRGILAVSSGNHGQAVALAARSSGLRCTVVMPQDSNPAKLAAVRALGAEVVSEGITAENREERVLELGDATGYVLVHPFDAWDVIHGQGTIGLELLDDLPDLGVVVCPVGGGGMASGCALAVKAQRPEVMVIAVEPELAADAAASKRSGRRERLATASPTIADGLRSMAIGEKGFEVIAERGLVDAVVTVSEAEIEDATVAAWTRLHLAAEPSGATALAGVLTGRVPPGPAGTVTAAVISGGNADLRLVAGLLQQTATRIGDPVQSRA